MVSPPLIAPFWLDFDRTDTNESGIYYRQTNDSIYLEFIHTLLMNASVGGLVDFFYQHSSLLQLGIKCHNIKVVARDPQW